MGGTLEFGAVVKWEKFVFPDGGSSDKLLVILGAKQHKNYLAVITTSQSRRRPKDAGCQSHSEHGSFYFIPARTKGCFNTDTWIELWRPQEIDAAELLKKAFAKEAHVVFNLPKEVAAGIRNCLKLSPDVSDYQISLLE